MEDIEMGRKAVGRDVGAGLDHCEGQLSGNDDLNMKDGLNSASAAREPRAAF